MIQPCTRFPGGGSCSVLLGNPSTWSSIVSAEKTQTVTTVDTLYERVVRAVTTWMKTTEEGREAWEYAVDDFNLGDLINDHGHQYSGIPMETRAVCHNRGKRIGVSFRGLMEIPWASPYTKDGKQQPELHTKHYMAMHQDLHSSRSSCCSKRRR